MLALNEITDHNWTMSKELDPIRAEAFKETPNWVTVAQRIADQPGNENFPVKAVEMIVNNPGELIVVPYDKREGVFAIGAIIAANSKPFSLIIDADGSNALRIEPETKRIGTSDNYMYAEREIRFSAEPDGFRNWMAAGIAETNKTILAASTAPSQIVIGAERIKWFFDDLIGPEQPYPKDRILGSLFQVAMLAHDFEVPIPEAPAALGAELAGARAYYLDARKRATTILAAREAIDELSKRAAAQSTIPRPAIHFERPLDTPDKEGIKKAQEMIYGPNWPTRQVLQDSLRSSREALSVLDALKSSM